MQGNKGRDTKPELEARRLLRDAGYPGYRLHWKKAPGRPDIAYPSRKIAVFINGCFWHRCPHCAPHEPKSNTEYWSKKLALNVARDNRKTRLLEAEGWSVFVIWECQLRIRPAEAIAPLLSALHDEKAARRRRRPPSDE